MTGLISPLEIAAGDQPQSPSDTTDAPQQVDDLSLVRELVLKAHPDVVPELIGGDSIASIVASITPAQTAYSELVAKIQANSGTTSGTASGQATPGAAVPRVPAGSTVSTPLDPDRVPAAEKLRRGVRDRANRAGR